MSEALTEAEVEEIRGSIDDCHRILLEIFECDVDCAIPAESGRCVVAHDLPRLLASHEELRRRGAVMREALEYLRDQLPSGLEYESRIAADALKEVKGDG